MIARLWKNYGLRQHNRGAARLQNRDAGAEKLSGRAFGFVEPCLPTPAKAPPSGPDWLHESKHDGFRIMARRDATGVRQRNF
jgi:ATP-dependent DNA ligase